MKTKVLETTTEQDRIKAIAVRLDKDPQYAQTVTDEDLTSVGKMITRRYADSLAQGAVEQSEVIEGALVITANTPLIFMWREFFEKISQEWNRRGTGTRQPNLSEHLAAENGRLRLELVQLWADNHLTANHLIGITHHSCGAGCDDGFAYYVGRDGSNYSPNERLVAAMLHLFENHEFDKLEAWPCCDCGNVMFERTIYRKPNGR